MPWLIAAAVIGVIYLWDRAAKAATSAAQEAIYGSGAPQPARVPQNVAPFVAGAPQATYNFDSAAFNWSDHAPTQGMRVGDTMTMTMPNVPGALGWTVTVDDAQSGADDTQSAVYPFGYMTPGLSTFLTPGQNTITYGFLAVRPGTTTVTFAPSTGGGAYKLAITVK